MEYREQALRDMLASKAGASVGRCITDHVSNGGRLLIHMADGHTLALTDLTETVCVLKERFGWTLPLSRPN